MKKFIVVICCILLQIIVMSGCTENTSAKTITISNMNTVQTVNYIGEPVKLVVSGMNCIITVTKKTNLKEVDISGMNSIVRVSRSHSFVPTIDGLNAQIVFYD